MRKAPSGALRPPTLGRHNRCARLASTPPYGRSPLPRAIRQKSSCPEVSGAGSSGYPALQRCSSALQRCKLHRCSAMVLAAPRGAEAARSLRFQGRASAPGSHDRRDRLDSAPPTFGSASPTRHTPQALLPGGTPVQGRAAACSVLQHCPPAYHGRRLHRCSAMALAEPRAAPSRQEAHPLGHCAGRRLRPSSVPYGEYGPGSGDSDPRGEVPPSLICTHSTPYWSGWPLSRCFGAEGRLCMLHNRTADQQSRSLRR